MSDLNLKVEEISSANQTSELKKSKEVQLGQKEERKSKSTLKKKPSTNEKHSKGKKLSTTSKEITTVESDRPKREGSSLKYNSANHRNGENIEDPYQDSRASSKNNSALAIHNRHQKNKSVKEKPDKAEKTEQSETNEKEENEKVIVNSQPSPKKANKSGNPGNIFNGGKIRIDLTYTRYKVLREIALELQWKVVSAKKKETAEDNKEKKGKEQQQMTKEEKEKFLKDELARQANVDIIWHDVTIPSEKLNQLKGFQKVNHFPAMCGVTKKNQLAMSLKKMKNQYPIDFGFFPKTWIIPHQLSKLRTDIQKEKELNRNPIMIVKPSEACQGKGIFFINDFEKLKELLNLNEYSKKNKEAEKLLNQPHVVQRYVPNPYLLDGLKFDLRLYVVVTSCQPLTIFWHQEGIARFATQPYSLKVGKEMPNLAHLTNYAINKDSAGFRITDEDIATGQSSKRTLETVYKRLAEDGVDINLLKLKIADLIIKTLISIQPDLLHNYRTAQPNDRTFNMCFEVLGFDVLIDSDTKPWLLEVNQAPSFQTDSELDYKIKKTVLMDTFKLLGVNEQYRQKNIDRIL